MLHIYDVDIVHPESGEVLAECGEVLDAQSPRAKHALAVARAYPDHYFVYTDENEDMTAVADGPTEF